MTKECKHLLLCKGQSSDEQAEYMRMVIYFMHVLYKYRFF